MKGEIKYVQIDLFDTDKYEQPQVDETPIKIEGDVKKPKAVYLKKNSYSQHILFGKTAYLLQNENSWPKDTCMRSVRMLAKYIETTTMKNDTFYEIDHGSPLKSGVFTE